MTFYEGMFAFWIKLFMRSRNMEEDMTEDRNLWRLGEDGPLLTV